MQVRKLTFTTYPAGLAGLEWQSCTKQVYTKLFIRRSGNNIDTHRGSGPAPETPELRQFGVLLPFLGSPGGSGAGPWNPDAGDVDLLLTCKHLSDHLQASISTNGCASMRSS